MIVCTKCSTENADDDEFCGGCGEFLEWAGQKVTTAPEPAAPEPESDEAPEPESLAPKPDPVAPKPEPAPAEPLRPAAPQPPAPQPAAEKPAAPQPAAAQPAPVTPEPVQPKPVQPEPVQPAPVLPSKPVPQRAEPVPAAVAEPEMRPGEIPCPACGAGNEQERSFCRRCGASLAAAPEEAKKPSWFKKLVTKDPKVHAAGDRPMRDKKGKFKP